MTFPTDLQSALAEAQAEIARWKLQSDDWQKRGWELGTQLDGAQAEIERLRQFEVESVEHETDAEFWKHNFEEQRKRAEAAEAKLAEQEWRDISSAPLGEDVQIGWWEEWPERRWVQRTAWAGAPNTKPRGMSNAWRHGSATHWRPLPAPPDAQPKTEQE